MVPGRGFGNRELARCQRRADHRHILRNRCTCAHRRASLAELSLSLPSLLVLSTAACQTGERQFFAEAAPLARRAARSAARRAGWKARRQERLEVWVAGARGG